MIRKTRGIVLHTTRYGESSLVVHSYTEQWGRQALMVKGVRKSRKNNRSNLFQPLFVLDFEVYHRDNRDMQLVKEASRAFPLNSMPYEMTKSTQALFIAEVLYRVIREEEPNPVLSGFLVSSIQYLDALPDPLPDFHIVFLFQLSRHLGFYPHNNFGEQDRYFDMASGRFKSAYNNPVVQLDETSSVLWNKYIALDYAESANMGFNSGHRKSVLDSLVKYYRNHVEGLGEIKSLEVLHDFFHNL